MSNKKFHIVGYMYLCDGVFMPEILATSTSYEKLEDIMLGMDPMQYQDLEIVSDDEEDEL